MLASGGTVMSKVDMLPAFRIEYTEECISQGPPEKQKQQKIDDDR